MLCEVCEMDAIGDESFAFKGNDVGENFDESGFSGTVGCDEGEFVSSIDTKVEVFIYDVVVVSFGNVAQFEENLWGSFRFWKVEMQFFSRLQ